VFDWISVRWLPTLLIVLIAGIWIASLTVDQHHSVAQRARAQPGAVWAVVRQPTVLAFFAVFFLLQVAHGPYYTFFSVFLEQHGYHRAQTGLLWALGVSAEVLLFMVMP